MEVSGREYDVGDVVWTVDPLKLGDDAPRMFVILSTRTLHSTENSFSVRP